MAARAGWSTPMLHVLDIERSLRWWALFGFETVDVARGSDGVIGWARMHCEGGALMFLRLEDPTPTPVHDRFMLYLYTPDLGALRAQLVAAGVKAGPIERPEHMPSGELCLSDPDGYTVLVGHWSDAEHETWERERRERIR